jgi:hypothetical protein
MFAHASVAEGPASIRATVGHSIKSTSRRYRSSASARCRRAVCLSQRHTDGELRVANGFVPVPRGIPIAVACTGRWAGPTTPPSSPPDIRAPISSLLHPTPPAKVSTVKEWCKKHREQLCGHGPRAQHRSSPRAHTQRLRLTISTATRRRPTACPIATLCIEAQMTNRKYLPLLPLRPFGLMRRSWTPSGAGAMRPRARARGDRRRRHRCAASARGSGAGETRHQDVAKSSTNDCRNAVV